MRLRHYYYMVLPDLLYMVCVIVKPSFDVAVAELERNTTDEAVTDLAFHRI
uniref:Uncharacterized protein n=1 Tax=Anguilla anguilla TaxID=7936 RepID=A0A0E9XYC9_ANGAN